MVDLQVTRHTVFRHSAGMGIHVQNRLIGLGTAPPPEPNIASVVAIDSTHVRVNFTNPMVDNRILRSVDTYEIVGTGAAAGHNPRVYSVTPENDPTPGHVILLTDEMQEGLTNYEMRIHFLEEA
jgi:hypothetical protein